MTESHAVKVTPEERAQVLRRAARESKVQVAGLTSQKARSERRETASREA